MIRGLGTSGTTNAEQDNGWGRDVLNYHQTKDRARKHLPRWRSNKSLSSILLRTCISVALAIGGEVPLIGTSHAQQRMTVISPAHTTTVSVTIGKSQDVRTDQSFADVVVGNPDVADASPLTDHTISILGKKVGTTRVSVYDQDKKPVGIFDVEVSYDVSLLSVEIARATGG